MEKVKNSIVKYFVTQWYSCEPRKLIYLSLLNICMAHDLESLNDKTDGINISSILKNISEKEKGGMNHHFENA